MSRPQKYSRQREALYSLLLSVKTHPTAEWLYTELKKENANLSLATVYRNLNLLCETGKAIKIEVGDGIDRYDATVNDHCHFICQNCSSVIDIDIPSAEKLNKEAEELNGITIEHNSLVFFGLCGCCR